MPWSLECSSCGKTRAAGGLAGVCECGQPYLVRYAAAPPPDARSLLATRGWTMWRYREWLPLADGEQPVTLGEGGTPLLSTPRLAAKHGFSQFWVKDESTNPTGSFKARGLAAAITRAVRAGAKSFVVPTAGNAGVALAAYAARAGVPGRVYAPAGTPATILSQITVDVSTLREPYRIEGKKTLGLELAEQLRWTLPDAIVYPTGGGTGLIGMWKAFGELARAGWFTRTPPRMYSVQAAGCAPVVRAFEAGADACVEWPDPSTIAAGLRVPRPLGGRLILRALRESGGAAVAVTDAQLAGAARELQSEGIDACPEGGAALAGALELKARGLIQGGERVVVFNTGAGWLYRA
ncbi:MAG: threonine synthase [Gemmatimonadetes bacterium]|nr:MAG: threonine synthase [Gemmatimonadota bacterium]